MNRVEVQLHASIDEDGRWEVDAVLYRRQLGLGISWFQEDAEAAALKQAYTQLAREGKVAA